MSPGAPPPQPWPSPGELGWPGAVRQSAEQAGTPSLDPAGLLGTGMAPHSPLHCLGGHQEGHEVSPFQLLFSHEGTPNKQGAQDHACTVKGADG